MSEEKLGFEDLRFRVNLALYPPAISAVPLPKDVYFSEEEPDSSSTYPITNDRLKLLQTLISIARQNETHFIEIIVPTGGEGIEKLLCIEHIETLFHPFVERLGQSERIAEALRAGLAAGGSTRRSCRGEKSNDLNASYDEVDELMRRLRLSCTSLARPLFDEGMISAVVDQYVLEVGDSTPARFS